MSAAGVIAAEVGGAVGAAVVAGATVTGVGDVDPTIGDGVLVHGFAGGAPETGGQDAVAREAGGADAHDGPDARGELRTDRADEGGVATDSAAKGPAGPTGTFPHAERVARAIGYLAEADAFVDPERSADGQRGLRGSEAPAVAGTLGVNVVGCSVDGWITDRCEDGEFERAFFGVGRAEEHGNDRGHDAGVLELKGEVGVPKFLEVALLEKGHQHDVGGRVDVELGIVRDGCGWKDAVRRFVVVQREAELLEVVLALSSPRGFASALHRREQQGDQDRDDCNDDEEFDEGEASTRH